MSLGTSVSSFLGLKISNISLYKLHLIFFPGFYALTKSGRYYPLLAFGSY